MLGRTVQTVNNMLRVVAGVLRRPGGLEEYAKNPYSLRNCAELTAAFLKNSDKVDALVHGIHTRILTAKPTKQQPRITGDEIQQCASDIDEAALEAEMSVAKGVCAVEEAHKMVDEFKWEGVKESLPARPDVLVYQQALGRLVDKKGVKQVTVADKASFVLEQNVRLQLECLARATKIERQAAEIGKQTDEMEQAQEDLSLMAEELWLQTAETAKQAAYALSLEQYVGELEQKLDERTDEQPSEEDEKNDEAEDDEDEKERPRKQKRKRTDSDAEDSPDSERHNTVPKARQRSTAQGSTNGSRGASGGNKHPRRGTERR